MDCTKIKENGILENTRDIFDVYGFRCSYKENGKYSNWYWTDSIIYHNEQIEYLVNNIEVLLYWAKREDDKYSSGFIDHIISYSFIVDIKENKAKGILYLKDDLGNNRGINRNKAILYTLNVLGCI